MAKTCLTHKSQCCPHIETSQLICTGNQLTGFYMRATLAFNGLILNMLLVSLQILPYVFFFFLKINTLDPGKGEI